MSRVLSSYYHKRLWPPSFAALYCWLLFPPQEISIIVTALCVMGVRDECLFSCIFFISKVVTFVAQEQWICSWFKTYLLLFFKNIIDWKCQWPWVSLCMYQSYFSCALFWKYEDLLIAFKIKLYYAAASIQWITYNKFVCRTCLTTVSEKKEINGMFQLTFKLANVKKKGCLVTSVFVLVLQLFLNTKMQ